MTSDDSRGMGIHAPRTSEEKSDFKYVFLWLPLGLLLWLVVATALVLFLRGLSSLL